MREFCAAIWACTLASVVGCAASSDATLERPPNNGAAGASPSSAGSDSGAMAGSPHAAAGAPGVAGATGSAGSPIAMAGAPAGGAPGSAGSTASAGAGGAVTAAGTAIVAIKSFTLTGCTAAVSPADLEAKQNGLSAPKPTQSFADGTFTVEYAVSGQYGQVGIDLPAPADLTGCTISATLSASSWPMCGIYAVPFFFDGTLGTVAPFDAGEGRFVGEEVSNLSAPATINFKATGASLTKVGRIGINLYNCPASVTVGDLSVAK